jgi:dTDP-4-dehydrorhamnose reductase
MTAERGRVLVVGADGFVGRRLVAELEASAFDVIGTTRRPETLSHSRVFLDLAQSPLGFTPPAALDQALLLAGTTNYGRCETDPQAPLVNVTHMAHLAQRLFEAGAFVTFVSSNTVFGGERPWCAEDAPLSPGLAYGRQKAAAETALAATAARLGAADRFRVVRLTKVLAPSTPPLPDWFDRIERGADLRPFSDLVFAPISLPAAARFLVGMAGLRAPGAFHFSGAENVDYAEFARRLLSALGRPASLLQPTSSAAEGVSIPFRPTYSGLGMERTTRETGVSPEPLEHVIAYLIAERHARPVAGAAAGGAMRGQP